MGRPIVTEKDFISIPDGQTGAIAVINVRNQTLTTPEYPGVTFHEPITPANVDWRDISFEEWKTLMNEHDPSYVLPSEHFFASTNTGTIPYIEIYFDNLMPGSRIIVMIPFENDSQE
jgi:hypothetical protein